MLQGENSTHANDCSLLMPRVVFRAFPPLPARHRHRRRHQHHQHHHHQHYQHHHQQPPTPPRSPSPSPPPPPPPPTPPTPLSLPLTPARPPIELCRFELLCGVPPYLGFHPVTSTPRYHKSRSIVFLGTVVYLRFGACTPFFRPMSFNTCSQLVEV